MEGGERMKVLWLSRHTMTDAQLNELRQVYGNDLEVKQVSMTVSNAAMVVEAGADCDVLAVVLPPNLLADLVNPRVNTKPVIRALSNRVPTGKKTSNGEDEFTFVHAGWEQIEKVEIISHPLLG